MKQESSLPAPAPAKNKYKHKRPRSFKIDRLPPEAQDVVFDGFASGSSFKEITRQLKGLGHSISEHAVGRYWRSVWKEKHQQLREARLHMSVLKQALRMDSESPSGKLAEELLYTIVFQKLDEIELEAVFPLLKEARELQKTGGKAAPGNPARRRSSQDDTAAVRRRWRRLHGLDDSQ